MDKAATAAAFSVTVNGGRVAGTITWAEDDTVIVFTPRYSFKVGSTVVATVSSAARSVTGMRIAKTISATWTVRAPTSRIISYGGSGGSGGGGSGGAGSSSAPYYASEVYYLSLMNCTRTGGWVTGDGACSSVTHHTLPSQSALALDSGISSKVSRPYAAWMADRRILDHYANGTPKSRLCNWGGYCGGSWGENIASPSNSGQSGMIAVELYYQTEYPCHCEHYANIMNGSFHRVGIGVWVSGGVRVVIDFYS